MQPDKIDDVDFEELKKEDNDFVPSKEDDIWLHDHPQYLSARPSGKDRVARMVVLVLVHALFLWVCDRCRLDPTTIPVLR